MVDFRWIIKGSTSFPTFPVGPPTIYRAWLVSLTTRIVTVYSALSIRTKVASLCIALLVTNNLGLAGFQLPRFLSVGD
jgi:hypothetical protein